MYTVDETSIFQKRKKKIGKADRGFVGEINTLKQRLENGDFASDDKVYKNVYKTRVKRTGQGKRGAYRVLYFVVNKDKTILLIEALLKSEDESFSDKEIKDLIDGL